MLDSRITCDSIRAGSAESVEHLYRSIYYGNGRLLAARILLNHSDVHDCLHESFLIVLAAIKAHRIENEDLETIEAYIRTVIRRLSWEIIRGRVRQRTMISVDNPEAPELLIVESITEQQVQHADALAFLRRMILALLRGTQRKILTRLILQGMTKPQILNALQISETTYRLAKSAGQKKLVLACRRLLHK